MYFILTCQETCHQNCVVFCTPKIYSVPFIDSASSTRFVTISFPSRISNIKRNGWKSILTKHSFMPLSFHEIFFNSCKNQRTNPEAFVISYLLSWAAFIWRIFWIRKICVPLIINFHPSLCSIRRLNFSSPKPAQDLRSL